MALMRRRRSLTLSQSLWEIRAPRACRTRGSLSSGALFFSNCCISSRTGCGKPVAMTALNRFQKRSLFISRLKPGFASVTAAPCLASWSAVSWIASAMAVSTGQKSSSGHSAIRKSLSCCCLAGGRFSCQPFLSEDLGPARTDNASSRSAALLANGPATVIESFSLKLPGGGGRCPLMGIRS